MSHPTYRVMVNGADKGTADDLDSAYRALSKHATVLENGSVVVPSAMFIPIVNRVEPPAEHPELPQAVSHHAH